MIAYALRRLLGAIPTLFIIVTLAFFMMRAAPGGPFDSERRLPPEVERRIETIPEVPRAKVDVVWDPPWTKERMSEAALLELGLL